MTYARFMILLSQAWMCFFTFRAKYCPIVTAATDLRNFDRQITIVGFCEVMEDHWCECVLFSKRKVVAAFRQRRSLGKIGISIRVCLKIGYIPNYSHFIGIRIINHWV